MLSFFRFWVECPSTMLTLLEKLYGPKKSEARRDFVKLLNSLTSGLDAETRLVGEDTRGWIQVEITGPDSTVVTNYLRKRFGVAQSLTDIHLPLVVRGKIVDSYKIGYGLYVDLGLSEPRIIDALLPLYRLRSHLVDGRKLSVREMINLFCLHDNFPLSIRLVKVDVENKEIWAEPSDIQVKLFRNWLSKRVDKVITLGAYKEKVASAIRKSGVGRYVTKVNELGFLECVVECKSGTEAPGIIKTLGKYLGGVQLHAFSPKKVNRVLGVLPPL